MTSLPRLRDPTFPLPPWKRLQSTGLGNLQRHEVNSHICPWDCFIDVILLALPPRYSELTITSRPTDSCRDLINTYSSVFCSEVPLLRECGGWWFSLKMCQSLEIPGEPLLDPQAGCNSLGHIITLRSASIKQGKWVKTQMCRIF